MLDNPWLHLVIYSFVGGMMLLDAIASFPNARSKKGKQRSINERWKIAPRRTKWELLISALCAISATIALLEILGIIHV